MKQIVVNVISAFVILVVGVYADAQDTIVMPVTDIAVATIPSDIVPDTIPTVFQSRPDWKKLLLQGKLNLRDPYIEYPPFVKFCVDVYNWGDRFFNTYDTTYVVGTGKRWKAFIKNDNWTDSYAMHFNHRIPVRMLSDVYPDVGVYLSYMAVSLGYSLNVANVFSNKPITRNKFDFQFTCALFSAEVYYWENKGGTSIRQFGNYNDGKLVDVAFPGLKLKSYGVDAYYFVNNKKYSQAAAYSFSRYQKKSAGSFIAGLSMSHQGINIDFSMLPDDMLKILPSADKTYYNFNYNDFCLLLGYAYNAVMGKHWLFNITFTPSIGFMHSFHDSEDGRRELISMNIHGKTAFVYNLNDLFLSFSAKIDGHWYMNRNYSFFNSMENLVFLVGIRF